MSSTFYDLAVVEEISTRLIKPSNKPLRIQEPTIEELLSSIRQHGLLQPILVRPHQNIFEVVAGNRRFAACKSLRWPKIPCVVKDLDDREAFEFALTENVQRKSLNALEEALAFRHYITNNGWGSENDLARKLGKSPGYISQRIALLKLPIDVQNNIARGEILPSQARELCSLSQGVDVSSLASLALNGKTSSREMHRYVKSMEKEGWSFSSYCGPKENVDKDYKILKKSILVLRVAMSRVSAMVDAARDETTKEYLFSQRASLHEMIDRTIRLSMKRKTSLPTRRF